MPISTFRIRAANVASRCKRVFQRQFSVLSKPPTVPLSPVVALLASALTCRLLLDVLLELIESAVAALPRHRPSVLSCASAPALQKQQMPSIMEWTVIGFVSLSRYGELSMKQ